MRYCPASVARLLTLCVRIVRFATAGIGLLLCTGCNALSLPGHDAHLAVGAADAIKNGERDVGDGPAERESTVGGTPGDALAESGATHERDNSDSALEPGALTARGREEQRASSNPYVITAHRHNYVLPLAITSSLNEQVYQDNDVPLRDGLQSTEVRFQISLKSQLNEDDFMLEDDSLWLAITLRAWWQLYASDLSSPFRESNYAPEFIYLKPLVWGPFGGKTALQFGFLHESNGQVQGLSRSWNRLYAALLYERGGFVAVVRPWYRIPEGKKRSPDAPEGDDNPDIIDFMGHGDVEFSWRRADREYAIALRGNPATRKGAVTVGLTFPLFGKFRGFLQYFNGYGDSLIDYDHFQSRFGAGVALTNLF